jgi:5'(3')-deoxyribonucleotidase
MKTIYLDMDDVVADWKTAARQRLNNEWNLETRIPDEDWAVLRQDERFFRHLPVKEGAHELVAWCLDYVSNNPGSSVKFLTAIPHDYTMPYAANDKVWWANDYFPGIPVFIGPFSSDKWRHCAPGDILIDDRISNCKEWQAVGGLAHIYKNWTDCKVWLEGIAK